MFYKVYFLFERLWGLCICFYSFYIGIGYKFRFFVILLIVNCCIYVNIGEKFEKGLNFVNVDEEIY